MDAKWQSVSAQILHPLSRKYSSLTLSRHRQATERHSSRFELFFDLLFIGIVHQIADAAAELPNGNGLARYILTFSPAYSIWSDVREIINEFATDDLPQRLYILWIMALLVGYSTNAALIEVGREVVEGEVIPNTFTAINWTAGFFLAAKMSKGGSNAELLHESC